MAEVTSVIDNLDEAMAEKLAEASRVGRNRFEVVLDNIWHGEQGETVLHFRLVELTATQQWHSPQHPASEPCPDEKPAGVTISLAEPAGLPPGEYEAAVERVKYRIDAEVPVIEIALSPRSMDKIRAAERERYPLRTITVGGLDGKGPVMPLIRKRGVNPVRLAKLLASIISLSRISPHVLGIPDGEGPAYKRVLDYLSGDDAG